MENQSLLAEIDLLQKELISLLPMKREDHDRLWKKLRLEWNFNSNHIEGNTLTYGETELLLMFDRTTGDHTKREYDEMQAHDVAVQMVREWAGDADRDLAESDIRELNKIILVRPYWKEALTYDGQSTRREINIGSYKSHPNSVRLPNGEMFHYTAPENVASEMSDLMNWYRDFEGHPVQLAADLHYKFIRIHPFDDGNGRIARLLVNYILMRHKYYPIVIKSAEKEAYLTALQKADVGVWEPFREFIGSRTIAGLRLAITAAKGESIEEIDYVDKEISLLKKSVHADLEPVIPNITKSALIKLYKDSLQPLFQLFLDKHQKFDDLFRHNKYGLYFMGHQDFTGEKENLLEEGRIPNSIDAVLPPIVNHDSYGVISFSANHRDSRNSSGGKFHHLDSINIKLSKYQYIVIAGDYRKSFSYNQQLSPHEQNSIVNSAIKSALEMIKRIFNSD